MAETLTGSVRLNIAVQHTDSDVGLGTASVPFGVRSETVLANGDGAEAGEGLQIDEKYQDRRTLASGANETLLLRGSLVNEFGRTINFAKVKELYIKNPYGANQPTLHIGGTVGTAWTGIVADASDIIKLPPGSEFNLVCATDNGIPVNATQIALKMEYVGGSGNGTYDIAILGNQP